MARILTSTRLEIAALVLCALCACGGAGSLETATELPKTPRHPDGVALEPPPAMPPASDRAAATGVVALREPLADKDVEDVVRAYVRAFEREDVEGLRALLSTDAAPLGRAGGRQQLVDLWQMKIKSYEYQRVAGSDYVRYAQIERYTYEALGSGALARPAEMRPGDVYVRVPIASSRIGTELFGDVVVLLLRREEGRLKIAGQQDERGP